MDSSNRLDHTFEVSALIAKYINKNSSFSDQEKELIASKVSNPFIIITFIIIPFSYFRALRSITQQIQCLTLISCLAHST